MNNQVNDIVAINEKIKLTNKQFEVLDLYTRYIKSLFQNT